MKKFLPIVALLSVLLAACGAKTPPTMDPAQVQASAVAMAFTMSAQTQAAQPTNTPIPPTEPPTVPPPPSPTSFVLPTLPVMAPPTATKSGSGDPCSNAILDMKASGPHTPLLIDNRTKEAVVFSLYLSETPFACGFVPGVSNIPKNANIGPLSLPEGRYWPSAWIGSKASLSGPAFSIHGNDKVTLIIDIGGFRVIYP